MNSINKAMKCKDCGYYWQSDDEDFPQCHFVRLCREPAPCDIEDEEALAEIDRREREWLEEHAGYQE